MSNKTPFSCKIIEEDNNDDGDSDANMKNSNNNNESIGNITSFEVNYFSSTNDLSSKQSSLSSPDTSKRSVNYNMSNKDDGNDYHDSDNRGDDDVHGNDDVYHHCIDNFKDNHRGTRTVTAHSDMKIVTMGIELGKHEELLCSHLTTY